MPNNHRLFAVTRWLIKAAIIFSIFIAVILVLTLGGILVAGTSLSAGQLGMPADLDGIDRVKLLTIAAFAIASSVTCVVLVFFALRATAGIIETTTSGDPFVNENAERLMHIGWLLLAVEVIGFLSHPIFNYLIVRLNAENLIKQANFHYDDFGFDAHANFHFSIFSGFGMSPIGLLAVLLIFVLAQIFRRGSEMRAELETTV